MGTSSARWFAVMTRARMEADAATELKREGIEVFYPFSRIRVRRRRPGTTQKIVKWIERPYFSRYIFVRANERQLGFINHDARTVSCVVSINGSPLEIPEPVIDSWMERTDENGLVGTLDTVTRKRMSEGQAVRFLDDSPFAGLLAQISADGGGRDVRVWLDVLGSQREIRVAVEALEVVHITEPGEVDAKRKAA